MYCYTYILTYSNHVISMLASSGVDRSFVPGSGQTKDYEIGICCFSNKHAALRKKESG